MELGSGAHIGTAVSRSGDVLQLPSFSYVMFQGAFALKHVPHSQERALETHTAQRGNP